MKFAFCSIFDLSRDFMYEISIPTYFIPMSEDSEKDDNAASVDSSNSPAIEIKKKTVRRRRRKPSSAKTNTGDTSAEQPKNVGENSEFEDKPKSEDSPKPPRKPRRSVSSRDKNPPNSGAKDSRSRSEYSDAEKSHEESAENPEGAAGGPRFLVQKQYVKDLSFEHCDVTELRDGAKIDTAVGMDVAVREFDENRFECSVILNAHARYEDGTVYILEIIYAGLFFIEGIPREYIKMFHNVDCPRMLFPFVRSLAMQITRDSAVQPLILEPFDFGYLYHQKLARAAESQVADPGGETAH